MNNHVYVILFALSLGLLVTTIISMFIFFILLLLKWFRKERNFPKYSLIVSLVGVIFVSLYYYNYYYNLDFLPKGNLNESVSSPNGKYEIRTYHFETIFNRMARAEVIEKSNNKAKTIYFNDYDYSPLVVWKNDQIVVIGRETLDITKCEVFDFRHERHRQTNLPPQF
ncbi:DUF5412 family protein [Paenibacillus taiwanensis]|uniref:DUF5412 family protein n=1 Tax=Paenibacillus taiwanensis TaxID=401638 RepID=UPI0004203259|nr:DUF5412 family protein [Paenibacillus taiwanensis]